MKLKQFRGCGGHGLTRDGKRDKWDVWCLRCNPLPSPEFPLSPGQKVAKRLLKERRT